MISRSRVANMSEQLKRLKLQIGNGNKACGSDEYLGRTMRKVDDLPVFGRDGEYYSRALRRVWIEVRGKTYESQRDQYDFVVYCRRVEVAHGAAPGKEAAGKLRPLLDHLPRAIRADIERLLDASDEVQHRRAERHKLARLGLLLGRRITPIPLPG